MSDSVRPQRWQPTRLPRPWDSPGKNTGVGCHVLLQCMKVKSKSEVAQSYPTLSDPLDCSLPGSSIHGRFQARVLEWGAIAFSEGKHIWQENNHRSFGLGVRLVWYLKLTGPLQNPSSSHLLSNIGHQVLITSFILQPQTYRHPIRQTVRLWSRFQCWLRGWFYNFLYPRRTKIQENLGIHKSICGLLSFWSFY